MLGLIVTLAVAQVQPGETYGAVYLLDNGQAGEKMFDVIRRVSRTKAGWSATMEFRSPTGVVAVQERVDFGNDVQPLLYRREQHQTGGRGQVSVDGDSIQYEWRDAAGRVYRDVETSDQALMVGPMMFAFFMRHWPKIRTGEAIEFRILVPDRQSSYEFEFQKVGEVMHSGRRLAKCELRLSGFLGLFVGDMVFYLDANTGDVVRYTGIVLPKLRSGDDWTNFKGLVVYDSPASRTTPR